MAPATEHSGSFLGRISIRRNQIVSMEVNHEKELEDLETFQKQVAERLGELVSPPSSVAESNRKANALPPQAAEPILSISWLRKLLDVFLSCEAEFKTVLIAGRDPTQISKPPIDRLITEMLDRAVKALDICTAVVNGVDSVTHCHRLAEIAVTALEQRPLSDGSVKRAKRALTSLLAALTIDERETVGGGSGGRTTERAWSFGRRGSGGGTAIKGGSGSSSGSSRWSSIGNNWSAAKQIQAMSANLVAPRGAESSSGLAVPVYVMSTVTVFVMWVLVAAVPCQDRGSLATHLPLPKHLNWARSAVSLHEKIGEELRRKDKRGLAGLMDEMQRMERLGLGLIEFAEGFRFPAEEETAEEVAAMVAELAEIVRRMEADLVALQYQVREVFHRIVRSRTEILDALEQAGKLSATAV